jgi:hypothetical protein
VPEIQKLTATTIIGSSFSSLDYIFGKDKQKKKLIFCLNA